ncbi:MAG: tRNA preQ1(34) S-adenosylmethionine ribosyltransferase-isomerase QueA [Gammaproteobacteria bacterium]|nr:tRNA preQ1(34) S-adenosylmethionine ribosyltransferase-isomerase QueA [Gammaproteobacteria bacterium]
MRRHDFAYTLPDQLIAQRPLASRTASKLLVVGAGGCTHRRFSDVADLLEPDDLLVLNNTRVIKARLFATKDSGGQAEILVERLEDDRVALCQVRVSKPLKPGRTLRMGEGDIRVVEREGQFYRLEFPSPVVDVLEAIGHVPLPPYIGRADEPDDGERYQTVYSEVPGAVAAPTAGLHFDTALLDKVRDLGIAVHRITLHVGAGTFQPVRVDDLSRHEMHSERFEISEACADAIRECRGRVVAVGTTVVRALESACARCGSVVPGTGETRLFITPGYEFKAVDALITNFHLPESTLLMLVAAFAGHERVMQAYELAIRERYRFFSYGDAMFCELGAKAASL